MRVLQIAGMFPPGRCGVGDYVSSLAQGLARVPGTQVAVLTQRSATRVPPASVEVLGETGTWRLWELPRLVRSIRRWQPDVVHIHWPSQGFGWRLGPALLPALCKWLGIATVVQTWHEPWLGRDWLRFRLQRRATDGLVFVRPNFMQLMPARLLRFMPACPQRTFGSGGALPRSTLSGDQRARLRDRYLKGRRNLVAFFGFIYPKKGVEQLFEIADPAVDALVIAGSVLDEPYAQRLAAIAREHGWGEQLQYTGYLEPEAAADLLHAADAVVLPFVAGGGEWNTSLHGALAQGTLVVTTSEHPQGDDPQRNLYTAPVADVAGMRQALRTLAGRRSHAPARDEWAEIARAHVGFYSELAQPS
ncbi:MAG TPA: glycosyltransferase [Ramlibacter sp.]|nr:glycosyltransferase [Ramlibacter sp.]